MMIKMMMMMMMMMIMNMMMIYEDRQKYQHVAKRLNYLLKCCLVSLDHDYHVQKQN